MRVKPLTILIATISLLLPAASSAKRKARVLPITTVEQLQQRLGALDSYAASVTHSVQLPSAETETVYDIELQSLPSTDSIAHCNYYITWRNASQPAATAGFTACNNGDYFSYSDERLREYHPTDSTADGTGNETLPRQVRFTDLLPAYILQEINDITSDSAYTYRINFDAVYAGTKAVRFDAIQRVKGYDVRELSIIFDAVSGKPLHLSIENNPGTGYEQTVTAEYAAPETEPLADFSEATLCALYPDIFNRLRERDLRLENLVGTALPQISHPTLDGGGRYIYRRGDTLTHPTLIAVIDPGAETAKATVDIIRDATAMAPGQVDIIWAFNSRHRDTIEEVLQNQGDNETALTGAGSLIRDCGITDFPSIIFADRSGIIKSTHAGYNKNLWEIVIEMTSEE